MGCRRSPEPTPISVIVGTAMQPDDPDPALAGRELVNDADPNQSTRRKARQLAREVISDLFLDTWFDERDFRYMRDQLRESGLSIAELDEIYFDELAPVLYLNTYSVAGEWAGFNQDDLNQRCEVQRARKRRLPIFERLRRYWVTRSTIDDWQRLRQLVLDV